MLQELGISTYGGGSIHKPRVMLTEEDEYANGLYATNDSERNPKLNGANMDQKANGGYGKGNTTKFNKIMFPCPTACELKTSWRSLATCKNFTDMTVRARRVLVRWKGICPNCLKSLQRIKHKEISECKWKNCDNCQQSHHPLLCDKPMGFTGSA